MLTRTIDLGDTQADLRELISLVLEGTEIILIKDNTPLARLVPIEAKTVRQVGLHAGAIQMSDDFDEPLPEEFWVGDK
jgi:antitoxin (DNA-binding transcriptional repressor) of toxin-antitoxin stability system